MPGLRDLVESQLPKPKAKVLPIPQPKFEPPYSWAGPESKVATLVPGRIRPVPPPPPPSETENPYYVKGELLPGKADLLSPGRGVDTLNFRGAADERSAQTLHRDAGILDSYYKSLKSKGMSEDEVLDVLKSLAEDQKKARMQFYAKPVEIQVEDN